MKFRVIKENDLFYLSNQEGDIPHPSRDNYGYGLFTKDTRMLSQLEWDLSPAQLADLSASSALNYESVYRYTNREFTTTDGRKIASESLYAARNQFVDGYRFYEEGTVSNYGRDVVTLRMRYTVTADFCDMFEVRGFSGEGMSRNISVERFYGGVRFRYVSEDGVVNETEVMLTAASDESTANQATVHVVSDDAGCVTLSMDITVEPRASQRWILSVRPTITAAGAGLPPSQPQAENVSQRPPFDSIKMGLALRTLAMQAFPNLRDGQRSTIFDR